MKEQIKKLIKQYVKQYSEKEEIETNWKTPIVKFANANDEMFAELKEAVRPTHAMPQDFLDDAQTVISYFLPFDEA
ncbi:MAG: epoxyqueuosine reductase, partial [Bacillota bacterium]